MRAILFLGFLFTVHCATTGPAQATPFALPPWIPIQERASVSEIVLVADVVSSTSKNLNQTIDSAVVVLNIVKILKRPENLSLPDRLALQFVLYPGSFEARMRTPPEPGRYFVFLNTQKSEKKEGGNLILFRLYEPNPFAFDLWSSEDEADLKKLF